MRMQALPGPDLKKAKYFFPAVACTLLIFILSTLPADELRLPDFWDLLSLDKFAHALFYGVLFITWHLAYQQLGGINKWVLALCCIAYGVALEFYQGFFLSNRVADWVDALANSIGVAAAWLFLIKIDRNQKQKL
jgi:VanZ family protein